MFPKAGITSGPNGQNFLWTLMGSLLVTNSNLLTIFFCYHGQYYNLIKKYQKYNSIKNFLTLTDLQSSFSVVRFCRQLHKTPI